MTLQKIRNPITTQVRCAELPIWSRIAVLACADVAVGHFLTKILINIQFIDWPEPHEKKKNLCVFALCYKENNTRC